MFSTKSLLQVTDFIAPCLWTTWFHGFICAVTKAAKHGTVCLHLPEKELYLDLTIHMDVQINPGPTAVPVTEAFLDFLRKEPIFNSSSNSVTRSYSRDQLLSLHPLVSRRDVCLLLPCTI